MPPSKKKSLQTADPEEKTDDLKDSKAAFELATDDELKEVVPEAILKALLDPENVVRRIKKDVGVVIADDDEDVRKMIRTYLVRSLGFKSSNVYLAADGNAALEVILGDTAKQIKLVISDVNMPHMDGLELIKQIREHRGDVIRVLMSGYGEQISLHDARYAQHHLEKPFEVKDVRKVVTHALMEMRGEIGFDRAVRDMLLEYRHEQAVQERKQALKDADRDAAIRYMASLRAKPDLSAHSQPYGSFDAKVFTLFKNHPVEMQCMASDDWEVNRGAEGTEKLFGLSSLVGFEKMISANTDLEKNVTCLLGDGDCRTFDDLKAQGSENYHVGIADAILYLPSEILDRSLIYSELSTEETLMLVELYNSEEMREWMGARQVKIIGRLLNNALLTKTLTDEEAISVQGILKKLADELNKDEIGLLAMIGNKSSLPSMTGGNKSDLLEGIVEWNSDELDETELSLLKKLLNKPLYLSQFERSERIYFKKSLHRLLNDKSSLKAVAQNKAVIKQLIHKLEELNEFLKINRRLQALLLESKGRWGRLVIDLNNPVDQLRFRNILLNELPKNKRFLALSRGMRSYKGSSGKFQGDKNSKLSKPEIPYFKRLGTIGMKAWLKKHYKDLLQLDSKDDLRDLLDSKERDVFFMDFKDIPKNFEGIKQMFSFILGVKSFSHLENFDYTICVNEMAARLVPGGGVLVDIDESYTDYLRIDELASVHENLGPGYKMEFIANNKGPACIFIQRGKLADEGHYEFLEKEKLDAQIRCGYSVVPFEDFEKNWPMLSLKNRVIAKTKDKIINEFTGNIAEDQMKHEIVQTWRHEYFRIIHGQSKKGRKFERAFERASKRLFGKKSYRKNFILAMQKAKRNNSDVEFFEQTSEQIFDLMNKKTT